MIKTIDKIIDCFETVAIVILMMIATIVAIIQVVARYVFSNSLYWSEETILYSLISMSFVAASMGLKYGAHISVELINLIPFKQLKMILKVVSVVLGILFAISVIYYGFHLFVRTQMMNQLSPAMQIPVAYIYLIIPMSGVLMLLRYLVILALMKKNEPIISGTPLSI